MIKNERQYRITKAQVEKFRKSLSEIEKEKKTANIHPLLLKAEKDAQASQLLDLQREIQEYEDLRTGKFPVFELLSIEDLPKTLIKARIALGLSQKDLAERIGLQEQQIQRYEAIDYESASVARVKEIIKALNLKIKDVQQISDKKISTKNFFKRISTVGLNRNFVIQRLLPPSLAVRFDNQDAVSDMFGFQAAAHLGRIFGWKLDQFFGTEPLVLNTTSISKVNFKIPKRTNEMKLNVDTLYARHIALLIFQATEHLPQKNLLTDPDKIREAILSSYGTITFENLVRYIWNQGVPVLALDPASFHSACFRDNDRSVIVLTQKTLSEALWMFNLMHEFYHAAMGIEQIVESENELRGSNDEEEQNANRFADTVLFGRDPHELATSCLDEAANSIPRLKKAVQKIAKEEKVRVDILANYLAYRLSSEQNINWWPTAYVLQNTLESARRIVRDVMLEYADFSVLAEPDLELLKLTLNVVEVVIND